MASISSRVSDLPSFMMAWRRTKKVVRRASRSGMIWLPSAEMLNRASRFVVGILIARTLGPALYGDWLVAATLGMILTAGGDLGLATATTRRVAFDRTSAQAYLANILVIIPILIVPVLLGLVLARPALDEASRDAFLLLGVGGAFECMALLALSPLRGREQTAPEASIRAFQGAALMCGGLTLFGLESTAVGYALLFALVGISSLCIALAFAVISFGWTRPRFEARRLWSMLPESLSIFLSLVAVLIYFRADVLLLASLGNDGDAGVYGAAYNVAFGITFIPLMFGRVLFPRFAAEQDLKVLRASFESALKRVALAALITVLGLIATMPLLQIAYGEEFSEVYRPFALLIAAQALFFITHVHYSLLLARGRIALIWVLTGSTLTINVAANLVLIPFFHASGASLGLIISEGGLLIVQLVIVRRMFPALELAHRHTYPQGGAGNVRQRPSLLSVDPIRGSK